MDIRNALDRADLMVFDGNNHEDFIDKMEIQYKENSGYEPHEYELSNHLNSCFNSNAPVCIFQTGAFLLFSRGIVLRCRSPPFLSRFCKPQI